MKHKINVARPVFLTVISKLSLFDVLPTAWILLLTICQATAMQLQSDPSRTISLTEMTPVFITESTGSFSMLRDGKFTIGADEAAIPFTTGLKTVPNSQITYILDENYSTLNISMGLEHTPGASTPAGTTTSPAVPYAVRFEIWGDGDLLYNSGNVTASAPPCRASLKISRIRELTLIVRYAPNSSHAKNNPPAIWADPVLVPEATRPSQDTSIGKYVIKGGNHTKIKINSQGHIVAINDAAGKSFLPVSGATRMAGCREIKLTEVRHLPDGAMAFTHLQEDTAGYQYYVTDAFVPTPTSVRWTTDIYSPGTPHTKAVITSIQWPATKSSRFWTAWSSPDMLGDGTRNSKLMTTQWRDPLQPRPFRNSSRWFGGNPILGVPISGDLFSIPIATILDPRDAFGFSVAQSPEDTLFYLKLITTRDGRVEFQRRFNRLGGGKHVRFNVDLINHARSWRSGMQWMVRKYSDYFDPVNPDAYNLSGCGAYSSWEGKLDTAKLNQMAFKFNWKASFDFPYMGMFMPPVDHWQTFATPAEATKDPSMRRPHKGQLTSRKRLNDYSSLMRDYGDYVLNYFNVTEFGSDIKGADAVEKNIPEKDIWKNSTDFLYKKIADGILLDEAGSYYRTWGNAIVMDPGATNYQNFLITQAKRTIEYLPASAGICIDRMDWLIHFNTRADDGLSWYNNAPSRSLLTSWKGLMERLGPLMHHNHKIVFANPLLSSRLDVMKHIDGIYSEYNETGPGLNLCAFLGMRMPVVAWTYDTTHMQPDPNLFFQRMLYMGTFPTAPIPYNNHTILPSTFADQWYLAYGPLLKSMEKRQWVLTPHPVTIPDHNALVNIFKVPGGYCVPVVMAANGASKIRLIISRDILASMGAFSLDVLQPGSNQPISIPYQKSTAQELSLEIPVRRGCAVVRIRALSGS